ncbi:MAG: heme-binding protein [Coriobacteriia bacterium]|nr:heme-binding protein [Coriobacteriia bacterium]
MSVESPKYEVLRHDGEFELRRYDGYLTANVRIAAAGYSQAANAGFGPLADYIFGNNHASDRIAMTAPVTSGMACCQKIAMTAPVSAAESQGDYVVSFTMPSGYTRDSLPEPNNPRVSIESVPPGAFAVVRYSGYMNDKNAEKARGELDAWIAEEGLTPSGEPVAAQYDAPWKPGFARRNEILIPVAEPAAAAAAEADGDVASAES